MSEWSFVICIYHMQQRPNRRQGIKIVPNDDKKTKYALVYLT